jgi:signal transduction histidine kinase
MNAMLWVAILTLLAAVAHNASHGNGLVAEPAFIAAALLGLLAWLRKRDVEVARINRGLLLLYLALFIKGIHEEGPLGLPPTLPFLPNLILAAALLSGTGFSLLFVAVGFAVVTWIWTQNTLALPDKVMLQNLVAMLSILSVLCHQVWTLHHDLLLQLEIRAAELGASMRQRRRLLGTIFHDISNPLAVIMGQLQLDAAGIPPQAQDGGRIESMADRIRQIVDHAETFLLQESAVPDEKMQAVDVAQFFADTQDLFEVRLRAKRQHLTFASPGGLKVLGLPEVIRDSVLSNLVSNALKFSQTAAGLALEAIEQRDEVALVVRDTGPGIPEDVLLALHRRQSVISREGSGGEQGQGLGLSLVQEHLQRLGGRLELKRLPGGGTEARAWLKKV